MSSAAANSPVGRRLGARRPLIIGHRGCAAMAPENTLPAFQLAIEAGADLVELDYRHSRDGVPVVIHDATLARTTDARRRWGRPNVRVDSRTAAQMQTLDAGSWFGAEFAGARVPLLGEALDWIRRRGGVTVVERKAGDAGTCLEMLRARRLSNHVVVISFDWEFLRALHRLAPELTLGALGPPEILTDGRRALRWGKFLTTARLTEARQIGAGVLVWNARLTRRAVARAHAEGFQVWIYTVNRVVQAERLLAAGVDGLITNDPAGLREALSRRGTRRATRRGV